MLMGNYEGYSLTFLKDSRLWKVELELPGAPAYRIRDTRCWMPAILQKSDLSRVVKFYVRTSMLPDIDEGYDTEMLEVEKEIALFAGNFFSLNHL